MKNLNDKILENNNTRIISEFVKSYPNVASWFNSKIFYDRLAQGKTTIRVTYRVKDWRFDTVKTLPVMEAGQVVPPCDIVTYLKAEGLEAEVIEGFQHKPTYIIISLK